MGPSRTVWHPSAPIQTAIVALLRVSAL